MHIFLNLGSHNKKNHRQFGGVNPAQPRFLVQKCTKNIRMFKIASSPHFVPDFALKKAKGTKRVGAIKAEHKT